MAKTFLKYLWPSENCEQWAEDKTIKYLDCLARMVMPRCLVMMSCPKLRRRRRGNQNLNRIILKKEPLLLSFLDELISKGYGIPII